MDYVSYYESPLGRIMLASDGEALTGLWFAEQKYYGASLSKQVEERDLPVFTVAKDWLDLYFAGKKPAFMPQLAPKGSEFRRTVWNILQAIPYGETVSYGEIALNVAQQRGRKSMSAQAVGGAVGHNPISVIIPCHRVVGADGSLTGYAGGIEKKRILLQLEGHNI